MHEHVVEYHYANCSKHILELSAQSEALVQKAEGASSKVRLALVEENEMIYTRMNELQENRAGCINRLRKIQN